jgi:hypothetical protein
MQNSEEIRIERNMDNMSGPMGTDHGTRIWKKTLGKVTWWCLEIESAAKNKQQCGLLLNEEQNILKKWLLSVWKFKFRNALYLIRKLLSFFFQKH